MIKNEIKIVAEGNKIFDKKQIALAIRNSKKSKSKNF